MAETQLNQIIAVEKGVKSLSGPTGLTTRSRSRRCCPASRGPTSPRTRRASSCRRSPPGAGRPPRCSGCAGHPDPAVRRDRDQGRANSAARPTWSWTARCCSDVPVTYLLFLEKQLTDLHTFVEEAAGAGRLRVLDRRPGRRTPGRRTGAHDPHQEGAPQPRQGRGDREAPGAGRGVLRGRRGRLLDDGEVLRRAAAAARQRAAGRGWRSSSRRSSSPARRPTAPRSPTSGSATRCSATCSGSRARRPFGGCGAQAETDDEAEQRGAVRVRILPPALRAGVAQLVEAGPPQSQILAPVSVFAAEHRIDRTLPVARGCGFDPRRGRHHGPVAQSAEHVHFDLSGVLKRRWRVQISGSHRPENLWLGPGSPATRPGAAPCLG